MQAQILKTPESAEYFFEEGCFILELSNSEQDPQLSCPLPERELKVE